MKQHRKQRRMTRAQAAVELALIAPILLATIFILLDTALFYTTELSAANAVQYAARYAAVHAVEWSNTNPPASDTIQYAVTSNEGLATLINQDATAPDGSPNRTYLEVTYYDTSGDTMTQCGSYTVDNGFQAASGYTEFSCIQAGNMVRITIHCVYTPLTPVLGQFLPNGIVISESATALIEHI